MSLFLTIHTKLSEPTVALLETNQAKIRIEPLPLEEGEPEPNLALYVNDEWIASGPSYSSLAEYLLALMERL